MVRETILFRDYIGLECSSVCASYLLNDVILGGAAPEAA